MSGLTKERRVELLGHLEHLGAGQEETDPERIGRYLYPVAEHFRALEPDVVLIVGDRGSGKSQLKNVLVDPRLRNAVIDRVPRIRIPAGEAEWREAWPLGSEGPDPRGWKNFAETATPTTMIDAWLAYLVRCLAPTLAGSEVVQSIAQANALDVGAIVQRFTSNHLACISALDQLDTQLQAQDRWIFVSYDELDTAVVEDWAALGKVVRGVVSMWAAYARRWRRIRPKIFLRTDFYRHNREIAGADVVKLAANRVDLTWSSKNLYGVLIKRVLNRDPSLFEHFKNTIKRESTTDDPLGMIPVLPTAEDARAFVTRLAGEYMGANSSKGSTFNWLLDHLRDGTGRMSPRVLVWLVEESAKSEVGDMRAKGGQLIHHVAIRRALDRVSSLFVQQAASGELPWITGLAERLQVVRKVPWSRKQLDSLLRTRFTESWGGQGSQVRPPGANHDELRESLVELGILRRRGDDSFDVPDLYQHGLGLVRHGGVARD
jgi:hypothetical protein